MTGAGLSVLRFEFSADCGVVVNPKSEARNPKQYPMTQIQMTKPWVEGAGIMFRTLEHLYFELVSNFEFRASNLVAAKGLRWDISL